MFLWVDDNVGILFIKRITEVIRRAWGFITKEEEKKRPRRRDDDGAILEVIIAFVLMES